MSELEEGKRFVDKPPRWASRADWPELGGEPMVFIGQAEFIPGATGIPSTFPQIEMLVFGGKKAYPLEFLPSHLREKGPAPFTIEFKVLERTPPSPDFAEHHLAQHGTIAWSQASDPDEYESVDMMQVEQLRSVTAKPRWKAEEASWPFHLGEPMLFVGQWALPKNAVTRQHLCWDSWVFLFVSYPPGA